VATLDIDYHLYPVFAADEDRTYFLDRDFLSHGEDRKLSRAPHSPCLRHRAGSWWIDNDSDRNEAVVALWSKDTGRHRIPRQCSFALPDGDIELFPWDGEKYQIALRVAHSESDRTRPDADQSPPPTAKTQIGHLEADRRVTELFEQRPRTRTILAAIYREYLTRGHTTAKPLTRDEARRCMGLNTPAQIDQALQDVQRAIWDELGHSENVPQFLVHRDLLRPEDQMLIPHRDCAHARRSCSR
jgi:hypothetical protein